VKLCMNFFVRRTRMPPPLRNGRTELLADIDSLPVLFRILVNDIPAHMQSEFDSKDVDIHWLPSSVLETMVDRMRGSSPQRDDSGGQPLAIVELILKSYADYYNGVRTHRSLNKDAPVSRPIQQTGSIKSHAILGGLHHHYVRV